MPRGNLVTRTQIAARRDVNVSTVMSWIERYEDFPGPARTDTPVPQWWWPDVEAYCEANHLPRHRNLSAALDAEKRDEKILEMLALFPEGLTTTEIAALSGEEQAEDSPTANAVQVRYDDRLRRLEAADGVITRVAGTPGVPGSGGDGGPATDAELSDPAALAVTPDGGFLDRRLRQQGRAEGIGGRCDQPGRRHVRRQLVSWQAAGGTVPRGH